MQTESVRVRVRSTFVCVCVCSNAGVRERARCAPRLPSHHSLPLQLTASTAYSRGATKTCLHLP